MSFKSRIITAILVTAAIIQAQSCTHRTRQNTPTAWPIFPMSIEGTITEENKEYPIKVNFDTPSHGIIEINTHRYLCENNTVTLEENGLLLPIKAVPPTVKFITDILSVTPETLTSTESDGSRVKAVYKNEYTVTTNAEGKLTKAESKTTTLTITN